MKTSWKINDVVRIATWNIKLLNKKDKTKQLIEQLNQKVFRYMLSKKQRRREKEKML